MLKDFLNKITKKNTVSEIKPNTSSEEYYAGMRMAMGYDNANYSKGIIDFVRYMFSQERKQKENRFQYIKEQIS